MARQEESCWRCGAEWVAVAGSRAALKVVEAPADGWTDEGGSLPAVAAQ